MAMANPGFSLRRALILCTLLFSATFCFAQPANDDCINAKPITIANSGFGLGTFVSSTDDISLANVQTGETFAPALLVANLNKKSMWYKFTIPTTRKLAVSLAQPGSAIGGNDAGFAVYKINSCLPTNADISGQLTPLPKFGTTTHPCVPAGDYLVQVSTNNAANGGLYIQLDISDSTSAIYDKAVDAYDFGTLSVGMKSIGYQVGCHSVDDGAEICNTLANYQRYSKSSWHVFKTPAFFDVINLFVANQSNNAQKYGFKIYKGDVRSTPYGTLPVSFGCDSLQTFVSYGAYKTFTCEQLETNTTYSLQLFFKDNYSDDIRVAFSLGGTNPTQAPIPTLTGVPAPTNALGTLTSSYSPSTKTTSDYLSCNSRHSNASCNNSLPPAGIKYGGYQYNLSTFFTFTLPATSLVNITSSLNCNSGAGTLLRLFKQGLSNNCSTLDTANIVAYGLNSISNADCLDPGQYTLQVSGSDTPTVWLGWQNYSSLTNATNPPCFLSGLGTSFNLSITTTLRKNSNSFSLNTTAAFDTINRVGNVMAPLQIGTSYLSKSDTFGCANTVLPDTLCEPSSKKAMYRMVAVADSGILYISNTSERQHLLYRGDASALATAQSAFSYPQRITGLQPKSECFTYSSCPYIRTCVTPGTYTLATFGSDSHIGFVDRPQFDFLQLATRFYSPQTAENMGSLIDSLPGGTGTRSSSVDYFSCRDNAEPIAGIQPCTINNAVSTKAIYRQFYIKSTSIVTINYNGACGYGYAPGTLFKGKATDGINTLSPMSSEWRCINFPYGYTTPQCSALEPGWYTFVSYAAGQNFNDHMQGIYYNAVGQANMINITVSPGCPGPKYNRPYKAAIDSITHQPFLIEWKNRIGSTTAYPRTDTIYTLYTERFNCTVDTPFSSHPIQGCDPNYTKVTYYVFKTTQFSYLDITSGYDTWMNVYAGDVRSDSASIGTATPIHPCSKTSYTGMQLCNLPPGIYTLVLFTNNNAYCSGIYPTIYIDRVEPSRFDHAINAYDFGIVPPDSAWHSGKTGDVNPLNPLRAPSSDFIACTTGARTSDPTNTQCGTTYTPNIYTPDSLWMFKGERGYPMPRRNLWYTFVIDQPGYISVVAGTNTPSKGIVNFAVFKSDVDGSLPFSTVVTSGQVDSTLAQGLTYVAGNSYNCPYNNSNVLATFYRDPCSFNGPERYYVLVENRQAWSRAIEDHEPNQQVTVSVLVDSVSLIAPKYDHYYQAYDFGSVGVGAFTGGTDNYSCATKDPTDPIYSYTSCSKTLWYKFTSTISGNVRYRIKVNGTVKYTTPDLQLFREIIAGDSTSAGLAIQNPNNAGVYDNLNTIWVQTCVYPGTYYILLPGCGQVNEYVYPEIQLIEQAGDFCSRPVIASLSGPGNTNATAIVDCHTIGTDYGEFNPTLTCPQGATTTKYKSSWFRLDISGNDTLDVTTYITENTNVLPSDIKYRMMTGNCGAMQEQSCVLDALTQNTYKCLTAGSYFFQVFTPVYTSNNYTPVIGDIKLQISSILHADTCATVDNCLANANFIPQFDCTTDTAVRFVNYSTFGSAIQYEWDFGYGGIASNGVSPTFSFPALATAQTYNVRLKVNNISCIKTDSITVPVTIPARPKVNLGRDTTFCKLTPYTIDATSWSGSTYAWNTGATTPTIVSSNAGISTYAVKVTYNGCTAVDTIVVKQNPITPIKTSLFQCYPTDSLQLNSNRGGQGETYLWSTGSTYWFIWGKLPILYTNNVKWQTCVVIDSFNIVGVPKPFATDTSVCLKQPFILSGAAPNTHSYNWSNGTNGSSISITNPGTYWLQTNYQNCSRRDTIAVTNLQPQIRTTSASICGGQTYTLPSGLVVSASGTYSDTAKSKAGCDSVISSLVLDVNPRVVQNTNATICTGQTYTLPWGTIVNTAGIYGDTVKYASGNCDSMVRTVNLAVKPVLQNNTGASVCAGQTYTLPSGKQVNATGVYLDTVRYASGCDSLITTTNLSVKPLFTNSNNATICSGQTYTLPSGKIISATGTYKDTIRYNTGCDSLITTTHLLVKSVINISISPSICEGQTYTLPSGAVVATAGTYADTTRYTTGCDSLISTVVLNVKAVVRTATNAGICAGQGYTLPSGKLVNTAGTYVDTVKYTSGCDSLISTVNLSIQPVIQTTGAATICQGAIYTLPSGKTISVSGTLSDTIRYAGGCDSLITAFTLTVKPLFRTAANASVCEGQSYTLPSGTSVSVSGIYADTIRYTSGCDSLISTVNVSIKQVLRQTSNATICQGNNYVLPSGKVLSMQGMYNDTVKYTIGCDSLISTVNLMVKNVARDSSTATICQGQVYTLPSGKIISTSGFFNDTLKYNSGCDSVIKTINLTVKPTITLTSSAIICEGQTYILPSGKIVNTTATYRDTLKYVSGCDSVIHTVNLLVQSVTRVSTSAAICAGQNYTLPSGKIVNTAGVYQDTTRWVSGCDRTISTVTISLKPVNLVTAAASICAGQTYTLPSGKSITTSGIYKDTLRYTSGCDSIIATVALVVKTVSTTSLNATICQGQSFTMPSGKVVNSKGIYNDTLRYPGGCDSLITSVNLQVTQPITRSINPSICVGDFYTLPSGTFVSNAGTYTDVIKSSSGCDSIVTTINLAVNPYPYVTMSKSNDINCFLGAATLTATGGTKYEWLPQAGLNNPYISNPIASPQQTTTYKAQVTSAGGCTTTDSIQLIVNIGDASGGYLLPSAFTPNGDGKNDCFGVKTWGWVKDLQFIVFDRWGNTLFTTTDPAKCWDGTYKGEKMGSGAYVYHISAITICGPVQRKGTIVLIR